MPKHNSSKMAKILSNISYYEAGEYGLYWDKDGTMPWKEFYWVLQKEDGLSYIRQSHIKQLELLGEELPFTLEGNKLVLKLPSLPYEPCTPPSRLFHAITLSSLDWTKKMGLNIPQHRSFLPLWTDSETSLTYTKPSHREKIVITIAADAALKKGIQFYKGGSKLYLVETSIPPDVLHFPLVKQKALDVYNKKKSTKKKKSQEKVFMPGSFMVNVEHFQEVYDVKDQQQKIKTKSSKKRRKGPEWKREARKIRKTKRSI